jgi:hypothetical protein
MKETLLKNSPKSSLALRGLPWTDACAILLLNADGRGEVMNPIETAATLFDQGYT